MSRFHVPIRDLLVVLLTITTGAVDAASFLALGSVFASVITGNLVLLGVAAGAARPELAVHSGVALAGYVAGVAIGAPIAVHADDHGRTWPPRVTVTLVVELGVLSVFSVAWELAGAAPRGGAQFALVAVLAAAMGLQAAAVRRLGQMSSTYLTSTLTGLVAGLVTGSKPDGMARSLGVLAAIVAGAAVASVIVKTVPVWLPAVMLLPLAVVIVSSVAGFEWVRDHLVPGRKPGGR
jgi:uncharacterized membrane protein YoaK (UPF0700 family)